MKIKICILAVLAVLIVNAEDRQPAKTASKTKKSPSPAATAAPPAPLTLPAGATQVEPGTYTFTDAKGKKWIYRQTPFGLSRGEEKPADAAPTPNAAPITATEAGDVIKFERQGPFGLYRWEKKKSELADDERAAWERSKHGAATKGKQD